MKCLVALREIGPMTMAELAAFTDRHLSTCRWEMRAYRKAGVVYISGWQEPAFRGKWAPIYSAGSRQDVKRADTKHAASCKRYHIRQKQRREAMLSSNPWRWL